MKIYRLYFGGSSYMEGDEPEDYFTSSLSDARARAREELGDEYEDGDDTYVDITEMDVITSGRGYVLALLNRKGYAKPGSVKSIERWCWVDDGHGGKPRRAVVKVPPAMAAFRAVQEGA